MITPVCLGVAMYFVLNNPAELLFVAMSPLMLLGNYITQKTSGKRNLKKAIAKFEERLAALTTLFAAERPASGTPNRLAGLTLPIVLMLGVGLEMRLFLSQPGCRGRPRCMRRWSRRSRRRRASPTFSPGYPRSLCSFRGRCSERRHPSVTVGDVSERIL